jgi:hypothetical protein
MKIKHLRESIIDQPQPTENPYVWKDGKINPLIRIRIIDILREAKVVWRELTIVGSITGKFWSEQSDIDCTVFCDVNADTLASYRKLARVLNERHFFGPFPINFFFRTDTPAELMTLADGIYDLIQDKWIKEPKDVDEVEEVLKNPKKLATRIAKRLDAELDEIAIMVKDLLNDYNNADINLEEKLNYLQLELDDYVKTLDEIHKRRVDEFTKVLEGESLEKVRRTGSRNFLPYNVIYKLLVKWLYYKWSVIFANVTKDEEVKKSEVKELYQKFVRFWI